MIYITLIDLALDHQMEKSIHVAADKALHQDQEPRCSQEQLADNDNLMRSDIRGVCIDRSASHPWLHH